jgi:hypothetical protein
MLHEARLWRYQVVALQTRPPRKGHIMSVSETVPDSAADEKMRLRRSALSLSRIVASTLAVIAPAMSFFFGFSGIVQGAGLV